MKNLISYIVFILFSIGGLFAQEFNRPLYENYLWYIKSDKQKIALPETVTFVGNFDDKNSAYYIKEGNYGIINSEGKDIIEPKKDWITALGNGLYFIQDNNKKYIYDILEKDTIFASFTKKINSNWFIYPFKKGFNLVNIFKKEKHFIKAENSVLFNHPKAVIFNSDLGINYANEKGKILGQKGMYTEFLDYSVYISGNLTKIIDENGPWEIPLKATGLLYGFKYLGYNSNGTYYLYDRPTRKLLISGNYDLISPKYKSYYETKNKFLTGLIDLDGNEILKTQYTSIQSSGEDFLVNNGNSCGLFNLKKGFIIPIAYANIRKHQDFAIVSNMQTFKGLYSFKKNKEILPVKYTSIKIYGDEVRAYTGTNVRLIYLDTNHNFETDLQLANSISLDLEKEIPLNDKEIDYRLFPQGWFIRDTTLKLKNGDIVSKRFWGLRDYNDSVLSRANYKIPVFIENTSYNLFAMGISTKLPFWGEESFKLFKFINSTNGKYLGTAGIISYSPTDFVTRNYVRMYTENSISILKDNKLMDVVYFDVTHEPYVRYIPNTPKLNLEMEEKSNRTSLKVTSTDLENPTYTESLVKNKSYKYFSYDKAEFNYFDNNGDPLFKENFKFAERYRNNSAAVLSKTGWGVVYGDSIVIKTIYSNVERLPEFGDTIYRLEKNSDRYTYRNSKMENMKSDLGIFQKANAYYSVFLKEGKYQVYDNDLKLLIGDLPNIRVFKNVNFRSKEKKQITIFDREANILGVLDEKNDNFFDENYLITKQGGLSGLKHPDGSVILENLYKSFEKFGILTLTTDGEKIYLFDENFVEINKIKGDKYLLDTIEMKLLISDGAILEVYDEKLEKIAKIKLPEKILEAYAGLIFTNKNHAYNYLLEGCPIKLSYTDYNTLENGFLTYKDERKYWNLYFEGEIISSDTLKSGKILYHGEGIFSNQNTLGFHIFSSNSQIEKTILAYFRPEFFSDGKLKIQLNKEKSAYFNSNLEVAIEEEFINTTDFHDGFAAVQDGIGWTLINADGKRITYPSFGRIEYAGANIYKVYETSKKGLYDHKGNMILPVEYERLEILPNNKILCLKEGNIYYFDLKTRKFID